LLLHVLVFSAQQLAIDAAPAAVAAGDAAADAAGADAAEADAAAEEDMYALILKRRLLCRLAAAKHAEARRRCHRPDECCLSACDPVLGANEMWLHFFHLYFSTQIESDGRANIP
jgi:hypothetical protein